MDRSGISKEDSNVMQHSRLLNEPGVKSQFRMCRSHLESLIGYKAAVKYKQFPKWRIIGVILIYYPHPHAVCSLCHLTGLITKL